MEKGSEHIAAAVDSQGLLRVGRERNCGHVSVRRVCHMRRPQQQWPLDSLGSEVANATCKSAVSEKRTRRLVPRWIAVREFRVRRTAHLLAAKTRLAIGAVVTGSGLQGYYDFPLDLSREETLRDSAPSIFSIVEDLGLDLNPRKAPFDVLVIGRGNKIPIEN
jgi:uncharacterized protein (TIGR03435 family)